MNAAAARRREDRRFARMYATVATSALSALYLNDLPSAPAPVTRATLAPAA